MTATSARGGPNRDLMQRESRLIEGSCYRVETESFAKRLPRPQ
jgi:hypothetical protein